MAVDSSISIIFVNYRSAGRLAAALESLFRIEGDRPDIEVIVVNNDREESLVLRGLRKTYRFLLLENEQNLGFGQAANIGACEARGGIIGFLNPDTVWQKKSLEEAGRIFGKNQQVGVVGMSLIGSDGRPEAWSFGKEPALRRVFCNNLWPFRKNPSREKTGLLAVDWVSGGALFIRKNIFSDLGGFDGDFFLYFEDADLCRRVRETGYGVGLSLELLVVHHGGTSQTSFREQKRFFYASQDRYFRKHRPRWEFFLLKALRFLRYGM